jgi:hypothetical protein
MSAVKSLALALLVLCAAAPWASAGEGPRGTGDLGIVIERASGSVAIVEWSDRRILGRVEGLGDLSHASAVYSRDQRYAYIFGRDGGLTKLDLLEQKIAARVIQGGNSIGGAISDDGTLIARYGGEEFVCLLPGGGQDGGEGLAARMHQAIADLSLPHSRSGVGENVTVSEAPTEALGADETVGRRRKGRVFVERFRCAAAPDGAGSVARTWSGSTR